MTQHAAPESCSAESGTCQMCVSACSHKPGWMLPGEAERIAEYLGIDVQQLFETHLAADFFISNIDDWEPTEEQPTPPATFVLSPATTQVPPGTVWPLAQPKGTCVFLQEGRCSIHPVKPHECREWWCGAEDITAKEPHVRCADTWADHQDQIENLLGHKPEISPPTILDGLLLVLNMLDPDSTAGE